MPRTIRNARLENRTQRRELARERFHWFRIGNGFALGYRRGRGAFGSWTLRVLEDRASGRYVTKRVATADDTENADGIAMLTFDQAVHRARELVAGARARPGAELAGPLTVKRVVDDYLTWYRAHRKAVRATESTLTAHVLPEFGRKLVVDLRARDIQRWHQKLAETPARVRRSALAAEQRFREQDLTDPDIARSRKASANRILTVFRAVLNYAWREGTVPNEIEPEWRRVKPFRRVDAPRIRYLDQDEARRLLNACADDLRRLVTAALLTGCRLGELVLLEVRDYHTDARAIHVRDSKSGKPRFVPLSDDGERFFAAIAAGRAQAETLLLRADGSPWGKNHHVRALLEACAAAHIEPAVSFHVLRHTYASWLAMRGVDLNVIAKALGHADTRVTQRHYAHLAPSYFAQVIRANLPTIPIVVPNVAPLKPATPRTMEAIV